MITQDLMPEGARKALLGKYTSRQNKLWLLTGWKHFRSWYIDYVWAGEPFKSRMLFRFSPEGPWVQSESFEEDLLTTYKFDVKKKSGA